MRGRFQPHGARPPQSITEAHGTAYNLPEPLNGNYSWVGRGSICTTGTDQYAVWVDDNRKARIAKRSHMQGWGTSVDLSTVSATALVAQFTLDSHNTVVCGVDHGGVVHVAGDHHAVALKYMRTAHAGKVEGGWVAGSMVGTQETQVTYPQFIRTATGFFFWYRSGTSGDGDWMLNKWDHGSRSWSRVATVIQGSVDNKSAYPHAVAINRSTGSWHLLWTSRTGIEATGNKNIYGAYTTDEGVTWRKYSDGSAYTLPITEATGEVLVNLPGGTPETVLNGGGTAIDPVTGFVHSVWLVADSGGIFRYRHVWRDASTWHYDTPIPLVNSSGRVPDLCCFADGRKWMIFQNGAGGRGNTLRYLDLDTLAEVLLLDKNMLHHTPVIEYSHERDACYLLCPYERQDGAIGGDPADLGAQLEVPVLAVR